MAEIKPCPFCEGKAAVEYFAFTGYFVQCEKCNATSGLYDTAEEAEEHWNRRPMMPKGSNSIELTNADMLWLHLNDWAMAVSPTGYESEEEHKERVTKYATILECMKRVEMFLEIGIKEDLKKKDAPTIAFVPRAKWADEIELDVTVHSKSGGNSADTIVQCLCSNCRRWSIRFFNHDLMEYCPWCGAEIRDE